MTEVGTAGLTENTRAFQFTHEKFLLFQMVLTQDYLHHSIREGESKYLHFYFPCDMMGAEKAVSFQARMILSEIQELKGKRDTIFNML